MTDEYDYDNHVKHSNAIDHTIELDAQQPGHGMLQGGP